MLRGGAVERGWDLGGPAPVVVDALEDNGILWSGYAGEGGNIIVRLTLILSLPYALHPPTWGGDGGTGLPSGPHAPASHASVAPSMCQAMVSRQGTAALRQIGLRCMVWYRLPNARAIGGWQGLRWPGTRAGLIHLIGDAPANVILVMSPRSLRGQCVTKVLSPMRSLVLARSNWS